MSEKRWNFLVYVNSDRYDSDKWSFKIHCDDLVVWQIWTIRWLLPIWPVVTHTDAQEICTLLRTNYRLGNEFAAADLRNVCRLYAFPENYDRFRNSEHRLDVVVSILSTLVMGPDARKCHPRCKLQLLPCNPAVFKELVSWYQYYSIYIARTQQNFYFVAFVSFRNILQNRCAAACWILVPFL